MFLVIDMRFIFFHIVSLIYNQLKKFNNPYGEKYSFCEFFLENNSILPNL